MKKQFNYTRKERIAIKVQTMVAEILQINFRDDAILSKISLVGAESHGGLSFVRLFYTTRDVEPAVAQKRLEEVTRMVRYELAQKMEQKYVPDLGFTYDSTLESALRIEELLEKLSSK